MIAPNATLYVKNIDWKVKKPLLKRALYALFSRHGKVLEVIVLRRDGLRGQAWVLMEDIPAATAALQAENGFTFFDKDLVIEYAREKSDRMARMDGTYIPKSKRLKKDGTSTALISSSKENGMPESRQTNTTTESGVANDEDDDYNNKEETREEGRWDPAKPTLEEEDMDSNVETNQEISSPPSKYLLAQNLPEGCNEMMLGMLFRSHSGFQEVRMPRPGLAFVEFSDEPHATLALQALQGFQLSETDVLQLTYGKA